MSCNDEYHPKIKSDLKKLDKSVIRDIHATHLDRILRQPLAYERLRGNLEGIFSYHFRKHGVEHRIAYSVNETQNTVLFLMIGARESFYEILTRRMK